MIVLFMCQKVISELFHMSNHCLLYCAHFCLGNEVILVESVEKRERVLSS